MEFSFNGPPAVFKSRYNFGKCRICKDYICKGDYVTKCITNKGMRLRSKQYQDGYCIVYTGLEIVHKDCSYENISKELPLTQYGVQEYWDETEQIIENEENEFLKVYGCDLDTYLNNYYSDDCSCDSNIVYSSQYSLLYYNHFEKFYDSNFNDGNY